jgi:hypothetical protein
VSNELEQHVESVAGIDVRISTYKVGTRFGAKVETLDVGNTIGRGTGGTRAEAAQAAVQSASLVLELRSATSAFKAGADRLKR